MTGSLFTSFGYPADGRQECVLVDSFCANAAVNDDTLAAQVVVELHAGDLGWRFSIDPDAADRLADHLGECAEIARAHGLP
jgi:hypothetical protein